MDVETTLDRLATLALARAYGSVHNRDAVRWSIDEPSLTEISHYTDAELAAEIAAAIGDLRPVHPNIVTRLAGDVREAIALIGSTTGPVPTTGAETS